jgi:cytochrome P450/NADPH-cytochrome P450 reductase
MIGPGTGLAPFRGFLQERAALKSRGTALGEAMLFFGCRHPAQDFIYADQLKAWADAGVVDLRVAFSRDGDRKTYVQDLVREQGEKVWKLIEAGAVIYVCGDGSRMEPDVRRTLTEIARTIGRDGNSEEWIDRMTREQRYVTDVWTGS